MLTSNKLTESQATRPVQPHIPQSFFINIQAKDRAPKDLQKIIDKKNVLRDIEMDEIKMIRSLNHWNYTRNKSHGKKVADEALSKESARIRAILDASEQMVKRKMSDLNINLINSIARTKPSEYQSKGPSLTTNVQNEIKNTFDINRNPSYEEGIINNDHNRYLLYECIKNNSIREALTSKTTNLPAITEGKENEVECEKLKTAAQKIINNFDHLKGTLSEKYLNYDMLLSNKQKELAIWQSTKKDSASAIFVGRRSLKVSDVELKEAKVAAAQRCVNSLRSFLETNQKFCDEISEIDRKTKELIEEHKKLLIVQSEVESRTVSLEEPKTSCFKIIRNEST